MHQWTGPSLVQVMACRLFDTKPLPEPILAYCQLDSWEQISLKFEFEFYSFHTRKCRLPKWRPFCPWGDELKPWHTMVSKHSRPSSRQYRPRLYMTFLYASHLSWPRWQYRIHNSLFPTTITRGTKKIPKISRCDRRHLIGTRWGSEAIWWKSSNV